MDLPASTAQREYLEALMLRADIVWDTLCSEARVEGAANTSGPWDQRLKQLDASALIDYLKEQRR